MCCFFVSWVRVPRTSDHHGDLGPSSTLTSPIRGWTRLPSPSAVPVAKTPKAVIGKTKVVNGTRTADLGRDVRVVSPRGRDTDRAPPWQVVLSVAFKHLYSLYTIHVYNNVNQIDVVHRFGSLQ